MDTHAPDGPLCNPFTWREIQIRGLHAVSKHAAALNLARATIADPAPAPQWHVIERITTASVLASAGSHDEAATLLLGALDLARSRRLPHQIQRIQRIASRTRNHDLAEHAASTLSATVGGPRSGT